MQQYTIGRDESCDIVTPTEKTKVGSHHADLLIDENSKIIIIEKDFRNHITVNGFQIRRKVIRPGDNIQLGYQHTFQLHHYFKLKEGKIIGKREPEMDFSEEMAVHAKTWKSTQELGRQMDYLLIFLVVLSALLIALLGYQFTNQPAVALLVGALGGTTYIPLRLLVNNQKKKRKEQIEKENICPRCGDFISLSWQEVKSKGHHSCGAYWKV